MPTYEGTCRIGIDTDPAVIGEDKVFAACLRDGFDEAPDLADEEMR